MDYLLHIESRQSSIRKDDTEYLCFHVQLLIPIMACGFSMHPSIYKPGYGNREPQFENCDFDVQMMNVYTKMGGFRKAFGKLIRSNDGKGLRERRLD